MKLPNEVHFWRAQQAHTVCRWVNLSENVSAHAKLELMCDITECAVSGVGHV